MWVLNIIIIVEIAIIVACVLYWIVKYVGDINNSWLYYKANKDIMEGDTNVNISSENVLVNKIVNDQIINNMTNSTKTSDNIVKDDFNVSSSVTNNDKSSSIGANESSKTSASDNVFA